MLINFKNEKRAKKFLLNITNAICSAEKVLKLSSSEIEININFVSSCAIRKLNKETRGINKITDVLSYPALTNYENCVLDKKISKKAFPYDINPETGNIMLGDIAICVSKCMQQSKKYGTTKTREICYLSVHGFLHLLGYDHMISEDKILMRTKEEEILKAISLN